MDDFGLNDRSLGFGVGDLEVYLRDLYRPLERERDVLLPEVDDEEMLRFCVFPSGDLSRTGEMKGLCFIRFSATLDLFTLLAELEALLLLEELPDEDPDEVGELERDPDRLELSALLSDEELHCRKITTIMYTYCHSRMMIPGNVMSSLLHIVMSA